MAMLFLTGTAAASAQYYEIANQLPGLIQPALLGGFNYKGYVDAHYARALGNYQADFVGVSTSQGWKYRDWFFMGVGIGVEGIMSHTDSGYGQWGDAQQPDMDGRSTRTGGVMIPIFTDFRFNIGAQNKASFFIDVKLGCSFLLGRDYVQIHNGYLTNQEYFYLRPTLGVRIPVNSANPKQAINVGVEYQLLTANYWSSWNRDVTLNALGASISYEW